jgi:hypothetical protein
MSTDYELQGWFPFDEPGKASIEHVASVLDAPVSLDVKGNSTFRSDSLLVYTFEPKRENDRDAARVALGFDINLTLVFADYSRGEDTRMMRAVQNVIRSVLSLATVPGLRAVLIEEERRDDLILLSIEAGRVTLNRDFEGWSVWPEVLAVVPEPHHFESLRILGEVPPVVPDPPVPERRLS